MNARTTVGERRRPSAREVRYRIYACVMLAITVGAPVARAATLWAAGRLPAEATAIPPETVLAIVAALAVLAGLCVAGGAHIGPARASLPDLDLLFATPGSRARRLARAVVRTGAWCALLGAACGGVLGAALTASSGFAPWHSLPVLGGAATGLLLALAALVGQHGRTVRAAVSGGLLAGGATAGVLAAGGVAAALGAAPSLGLAVLAAVLLLGAAGALGAPALMRSLGIETLRSQALLHRAVAAAALTADSRTALARLGAPVRFGRSLSWRPHRSRSGPLRGLRLIAVRDLVGLMRTPLRTILAVCAAGLGGALAAMAILGSAAPLPVPVLGAAATLMTSAGASGLMRGYRAAADGAGGALLLPYPVPSLLVAHLAVPATLVLGAAAAAAWAAAGAMGLSPLLTTGIAIGVGACGVAVAAATALQGPLPMRMLAPVQTPAGDASGLVVLGWMLSGPIAAALSGALIALSWSVAPVWVGIAASAAAVVVCGWWWRERLHAALNR